VYPLLILAAATSPGSQVTEQAGVSLRVTIHASIYEWTVTNVSAEPITRFEVGQHAGYDFQAPEGWLCESTAGQFRAWTTDQANAIGPGQAASFSQRVSSEGAVLGRVRARIGFTAGDPVEFADIWGPQPEPHSTVFAVPAIVAIIVVVHLVLLTRRDRRQTAAGPTDA
jgi:hypothetical protein